MKIPFINKINIACKTTVVSGLSYANIVPKRVLLMKKMKRTSV